MSKQLFKTSLKCGGCINAIRPGMESIPGITEWNVNLESPDRILEVDSEKDVSNQVLENVKKAGYEISRL
ncbi:MAG: heavy-metal-associated domain-containing protein [Bacteroidetes bacterium]|nr:heavy-metal-associated domain-containing protein [Bacteroidota bacterium]